MRRSRKMTSWLGNAALGVVVLLAVVFVVNAAVNGLGTLPGGYRPLVVLSGSMEPVMPTGSLVLTKSTAPGSVQVGDVITFRLHSSGLASDLATHRVVAIETGSAGTRFVTKGDANQVPDPAPVPASDLIGRVVFVSSMAGSLVESLKTPLFLSLVVLGALVLLGDAMWRKFPHRRPREQALLPGSPPSSSVLD